MCLRVLNNLNEQYPVTGRNMNWFRPINVSLYRFASGLEKQGLTYRQMQTLALPQSAVFKWQSSYASVVAMMGDDEQGYAAVDGMNDQGLMVNALYDTPASYAPAEPRLNNSNISVLCWPQYILDSFADAKSVAEYARNNSLVILDDLVPEGGNQRELVPAHIHLAVSDNAGNSSIIEINNGVFKVYEDPKYQVVTNEPDYATQLSILKHWQYLWGQTQPRIETPIYTVTGGYTPIQSFDNAAFYLSLSDKTDRPAEILAQTRAFMQKGAIPYQFNPKKSNHATCTRWTNMADHRSNTYYFINPLNMMPTWLDAANTDQPSAKIQLIAVKDANVDNKPELHGDLHRQLINCQDPFALIKSQ
jgi:penicillin V acylase-like amidase (Ntn superfamily)